MTVRVVSLFSGCGMFDLGFERSGFTVVAQVEIDPTARDVLARHWPDVPRFEDVRTVGRKTLPKCDVLIGGFPCQDVSSAGKRKGFKGERSSLWFEMERIIGELKPAVVVWENVPGLLTASEGRDFLAVLMGLDRLGFAGGWRTYDAQYFGVPQQRRRVFGVFARGRAGAERTSEILALSEGVQRRTPKGRKTRAGVARTLTAGVGSRGVNPPGRRQEDDFNLVAFSENRHSQYVETDTAGSQRAGGGGLIGGHLAVFGCGDTSGERAADGTLTAKGGTGRNDFDSENFVMIQDARGVDKGQNGSGVRQSNVTYTVDTIGAQAVVIPIDMRQASRGETMTNNRPGGSSGGAPGTGIGEPGDPSPTLAHSHVPAVCVGCLAPDGTPKGRSDGLAYTLTGRQQRGHGSGMSVCVTGDFTHSITAEGADASEDGSGRGTPIVAFAQNQRNEVRTMEAVSSLSAQPGMKQQTFIQEGSIVRRLTPRECERLMGLPDDWTRFRGDGRELKDGPRYRLCGNGVVVPVIENIARRLMKSMKGNP